MYRVPQKRERLRPKKRTNDPKNPYFKWLRSNCCECVVCGAPGEIHHLETGAMADDSRVVMLCLHHHSAQSNNGIHHLGKAWHDKFIDFDTLENIAETNYANYCASVDI